MQIYSQLAPLALGGAHGSAVAMGFFDGIHIGHRAVSNGAVEWAKAHGAAPAVFTFRLPTENKMKGKRLLSTEDKHALIASLGVEYYLCPDFEEIKAMTPEQFVLGIIRDCNARALFCGENFTFGARAAGTPELLRQLCEPLGVEVVVLPMAQFEEKPVSSTRIRTALEGGDIPAANAMLGMPYAIRFTVHHGAGLGRTLGVPTINQLYPQGFQLPRYGIYITRTRIGDRWYPSATGLGTRPTVNSDESKVTEVCHLSLDELGQILGTGDDNIGVLGRNELESQLVEVGPCGLSIGSGLSCGGFSSSGSRRLTAGAEGEHHNKCEKQCYGLFHFLFSSIKFIFMAKGR